MLPASDRKKQGNNNDLLVVNVVSDDCSPAFRIRNKDWKDFHVSQWMGEEAEDLWMDT